MDSQPVRRRRKEATLDRDDGFTLVEMIVAIVIMGLVVAPLCMALTQAMNLVPTTSAREQVATDSERLLEQFSADVAQTTALTGTPAPNGNVWLRGGAFEGTTVATPGVVACPAGGSLASGASTTSPVATFWHLDSGAIPAGHNLSQIWQIKFTNIGSSKYKAEIQRRVWDQTADPSQLSLPPFATFLTGYCTPGASPVVQIVTMAPQQPTAGSTTPIAGYATLTLSNLFDRRGGQVAQIKIESKMRVTNSCFKTPAVQGCP
jgi:prepilin-type N-terminal cleavage/methylation domain-containing protein